VSVWRELRPRSRDACARESARSNRLASPTRSCRALTALLLVGLLSTSVFAQELLLVSGERLKGDLATVPGGVAVTKGKTVRKVPWAEIDWIVHRTRRFLFVSRIVPEKTRDYAEAFELFHRALTRTFNFTAPMRNNWTTQVRIYRDQRCFDDYMQQCGGGSGGACGFFHVNARDRIEEVVVLDIARDPSQTFDTLLHEGTHLLLHLWGKAKDFEFPAWIDEGMAEYFGGSSYRPGARSVKRVFTQGVQKPWRLIGLKERLQKNAVSSLEELLFVTSGQFQIHHYAEAWSLVHFLAHYEGGHYARRLYRFCHDLRRTVREGERYIELFEKTFKVKVDELETRWHDYIRTLEPETAEDRLALAEAWVWKAKFNEALAALEPLLERHPDDYRALVLRARALHGRKDFKAAHALLDRAEKLQPDYDPALEARAFLYYFEDRWESAMATYARYHARNPLDLLAGIDYLRCLLEAPAKYRDATLARNVGESILAYHRDPELLVYLGDAELALKTPAAAIQRYEEAAKLWPGNPAIEKRLRRARAEAR
jgi:tetratricopeptide (TPR) repeat protein